MATAPDVRPLPVQLNLNVRGLKASATLAINVASTLALYIIETWQQAKER